MKRKILHLITRYRDGGAEVTTRQTLDALHESDLQCDLRLGYGGDSDPDCVAELPEYVETVEFSNIRHYNPVTAMIAVFQVAVYLRRERIELLHTHSTEAGVIGRLAARIAGTPTVIHEIHGHPITTDRSRSLNIFIYLMERVCARFTTRFVVKSERIKAQFLERGIGTPEQYEVIYHGVPIEEYKTSRNGKTDTTESGGDGDAVVETERPGSVRTTAQNERTDRHEPPVKLLFVGRLAEGKGLFDLLEAIANLDQKFNIRLWIVGDGALRAELEQTVERTEIDEIVDFEGYRDDVPALLVAADALVLPSYREGTPRVVTEALAAGLPVVATRIAGIPEQVSKGETGLLVEPGDVLELTEKLRTLITSPAMRREMSDTAPETVEKFSLSSANEQFRRLYAELLCQN